MRADEVRDFFESVDAEPSSQFSDALLARLRTQHLFARADTTPDAELALLEPIAVDVLHEERGPTPERPSRRRRHIAGAIAAAATVVVATSVLVQVATEDSVEVMPPADPVTVPTTDPPLPALPDGLKALPPEGATPSTPETGQLLANLPVPIWVYEDGRVVFARYRTIADWTGFLERRLSPSGVELVRAEILANGPYGECGGTMGWVAYVDGGRTVCERPGERTYPLQDGSRYPSLLELPYGAPSWLPASAWADPEPKLYVPSAYEVQIVANTTENQSPPPMDVPGLQPAPPMDVSAMRAALPPEAAELLTGPGQCEPSYPDNTICYTVSTEAARRVAAAFGFTDPSVNEEWFDRGVLMGGFGQGHYSFAFSPYLPHEEPVWCCGG